MEKTTKKLPKGVSKKGKIKYYHVQASQGITEGTRREFWVIAAASSKKEAKIIANDTFNLALIPQPVSGWQANQIMLPNKKGTIHSQSDLVNFIVAPPQKTEAE